MPADEKREGHELPTVFKSSFARYHRKHYVTVNFLPNPLPDTSTS